MLGLRLFAAEPETLRELLRDLHAQGHRRFVVWPQNSLAEEAVRHARSLGGDASLDAPGPATATGAGREPAPCFLLTETDPRALSEQLLKLVGLETGIVAAPHTSHAYDRRPLFLISIPKAGTHLLYSLAGAFGYRAGVVCPDWPQPRHWYCVEHSNSHTRATDFFVDTVRRSSFGNRHHPFATSPALFIYRNPLDIVVSEANYYHRDGNAIFGGYLQNRSFEERLLALVDDPWLFGSIRERMAGFVPWLEFPNVIPVSFEELVGARGGGDDAVQRRLIWSLQLKLQVPGRPDAYAAQVFDPESATFQSGQIGAYARRFTAEAAARFGAQDQDFMGKLGYASVTADGRLPAAGGVPARAEEFLRRPLVVGNECFDSTPITVEHGYLGHNIVRYRRRYYALPTGIEVDLDSLEEAQLSKFPQSGDLTAVRNRVAAMANLAQFLPVRIVNILWRCARWWKPRQAGR